MGKRWPLHPRPWPYETLQWYIRRLADCYGARYEYFCLRALDIPIQDNETRSFQEAKPLELLQRLSDGTGIPVAELEQMTYGKIWSKIMDELDRWAETPEGMAWLEEIERRYGSQKS